MQTRRRRHLLTLPLTAFISLLAASIAPASHAASAPTAAPDPAKILLMLDSSGSMKDADPSGVSKLQAAKAALTNVINALPSTAQVGLRVYGASQPGGTPTPAACSDSQLIAPVGPLNKTVLIKAVDNFDAKGETPISYALTQGIKDLGSGTNRHIIMVSDGEESCVPDPCQTYSSLESTGIGLQVDTVGFAVNDQARTQLQCIASRGRGTYYDAKNADQLNKSLQQLSLRASRGYEFSGTAVEGGSQAPGSPVLQAGQYFDTLPNNKSRYYLVQRTPNGTLRFSGTIERARDRGSDNSDGLSIYITEPKSSTSCDSDTESDYSSDPNERNIITTNVVINNPDLPQSPPKACTDASQLLVEVRHAKDNPAPVELQVIDEPPVTTFNDLPLYVKESDPIPADQGGTLTAITGGLSFSQAPGIKQGRWSDTVGYSETLLYRVPVNNGQRLIVTLDAPQVNVDTQVSLRIYAPDREVVSSENKNFYAGSASLQPLFTFTPTIKFMNRADDDDHIRSASIPGNYLIAITVNPSSSTTSGPVDPLAVAFTAQLTGEVHGLPHYVDSKTPQGIPGYDDVVAPGYNWWLIGGASVGIVVALTGLAFAFTRRPKPSTPEILTTPQQSANPGAVGPEPPHNQ